MPISPFTTYNSIERVICIPVVPSVTVNSQFSAAGTTQFPNVALSADNLTNGFVYAYLYYVYAFPLETAAASNAGVNLSWQFQTAALVNVGAAVQSVFGSVSAGGGAGGQLSPINFAPSWPHPALLTIPATAANLRLQVAITIGGAPFVQLHLGYGVDTLNLGSPGAIGGGGMVAQSATNPNTF